MPKLEDPLNTSVLAWLASHKPKAVASQSPETADFMGLGTHPDLITWFYGKCVSALDVNCEWICYEQPTLVRPDTGIVFGLAGGTGTIALRLPPGHLAEAMRVERYGATVAYPSGALRAADIGDFWCMIEPFAKAAPAWCRAAFEHAIRE